MEQKLSKKLRLLAAAKLYRELLADLKNLERDPEARRPHWILLLEEVQTSIGLEYRYKLSEDAHQMVDTLSDIILRLSGFTNPVMLQNMKEKFEFLLGLKRCNFDFSKAASLVQLDPWFAVWEPRIQSAGFDLAGVLSSEQILFLRGSITQSNRDLPY